MTALLSLRQRLALYLMLEHGWQCTITGHRGSTFAYSLPCGDQGLWISMNARSLLTLKQRGLIEKISGDRPKRYQLTSIGFEQAGRITEMPR